MPETSYEPLDGEVHILEQSELDSHQLTADCPCKPRKEASDGDYVGILWYHQTLHPAESWENEGGA